MASKAQKKIGLAVLGWVVALLVFFPLIWMALAAFKTEIDAVSSPPKVIFDPTLENFNAVFERVNYGNAVFNSIVESVGATLICLIFAAPAAYAMAFFPGRKTKDLLMWMLS
ncbi:MAG: carbohydrate ABC transporter permease, partial [Methylobacteriaceae bacterium]|nr:carbohydrate ABC transporter permease [Methylobacteriaceae bacterium]